jgi:hypothetical protein
LQLAETTNDNIFMSTPKAAAEMWRMRQATLTFSAIGVGGGCNISSVGNDVR